MSWKLSSILPQVFFHKRCPKQFWCELEKFGPHFMKCTSSCNYALNIGTNYCSVLPTKSNELSNEWIILRMEISSWGNHIKAIIRKFVNWRNGKIASKLHLKRTIFFSNALNSDRLSLVLTTSTYFWERKKIRFDDELSRHVISQFNFSSFLGRCFCCNFSATVTTTATFKRVGSQFKDSLWEYKPIKRYVRF